MPLHGCTLGANLIVETAEYYNRFSSCFALLYRGGGWFWSLPASFPLYTFSFLSGAFVYVVVCNRSIMDEDAFVYDRFMDQPDKLPQEVCLHARRSGRICPDEWINAMPNWQ